MMYLMITILFFSCNKNPNPENIDTLVFIDKELKEEIFITNKKINISVYYEDVKILSTILKTDSLELNNYNETIINLSKNIVNDSSNVFLKEGSKISFLKNDEYVKRCILKFDEAVQLTNKLNDVAIAKVNSEIDMKNFDKAFKIAEMSVYLRRPFYKGSFKDDRHLKILSQKSLFEEKGKQKEAIDNLLKLN